MHAARGERVGERPHHVRLTHHVLEAAGPPFARQRQVTHRIGNALYVVIGRKKRVRASPAPAPGITATAAPFRA
ncbi:MAG: hypothetical protein AMXMBFR8_04150 [Nevskiales bacterium]